MTTRESRPPYNGTAGAGINKRADHAELIASDATASVASTDPFDTGVNSVTSDHTDPDVVVEATTAGPAVATDMSKTQRFEYCTTINAPAGVARWQQGTILPSRSAGMTDNLNPESHAESVAAERLRVLTPRDYTLLVEDEEDMLLELRKTPVEKQIDAAKQRMYQENPGFEELCRSNLLKQRGNALRVGDYSDYLSTYDKHVRVRRFIKIIPLMPPAKYWETLADTWTSCEVIQPDEKEWLRLLQAKRSGRNALMTAEEHRALVQQPDEIEIWRGCGDFAGIRGLSWTLDKAQAEWFAGYACDSRRGVFTRLRGRLPILVKAVCKKSDVLAHFLERDEAEIVVNPKKVKVLQAQRIKNPFDRAPSGAEGAAQAAGTGRVAPTRIHENEPNIGLDRERSRSKRRKYSEILPRGRRKVPLRYESWTDGGTTIARAAAQDPQA